MKNPKRWFIYLLIIPLLATCGFPTVAIASDTTTHQPGGTLTPPPSQIELISPLFTQYLNSWNCNIVNNRMARSPYQATARPTRQSSRSGSVFTCSNGMAHSGVTVAGGYKTTEYSTYYASGQKWLSVQRGYYYRSMAQHQVINQGVHDPDPPATSTSNYILIE